MGARGRTGGRELEFPSCAHTDNLDSAGGGGKDYPEHRTWSCKSKVKVVLVTVQTAEQDGVLVLSIAGEIDMANVEEVREKLVSNLPKAAFGIVVDLSQTTYIDSRGVYLLLDIDKRLKAVRKRLRIVCAGGSTVRRVLQLTQVPIPVDDTLEDALNLIRNHAAPRRS